MGPTMEAREVAVGMRKSEWCIASFESAARLCDVNFQVASGRWITVWHHYKAEQGHSIMKPSFITKRSRGTQ
jgi:hypothetical protein